MVWLALVSMMLGAGVTGCSRQESEWRRVRAQDTVAGYEDYLQRRPLGPHADEARERLRALREERAWERALRLDAPEAFQQYLGAYPDGRFAEEARERLADFLLAQAPSTGPDESAAVPAPALTRASPPAAPVAAKAKPAPAVAAAPSPAAAKPPAASTPRVVAPQVATPKKAAASPSPSKPVSMAPPKPAAPPAPHPTPKATVAKPQPTPPPVAAPAVGARGAWRVQLGAFSAGDRAARSAWERLRAAHRRDLAGLEPEIDTLTRDGRTLWRLRAGQVDRERARSICTALRARGAACSVVAP